MKDSLAFITATLGAGSAQTVQFMEGIGSPDETPTMIGGAITMLTGLLSMLLSRWLNKKFNTKGGGNK